MKYVHFVLYWTIIVFIILIVIGYWLFVGVMAARADCSGHVVQPGDTLYRIARANGTTWQELARVNGLTAPDKIYAGQCLLLGAGQTATTVSQAKGLAMADTSHPEDLIALNIGWWYTWGENCNGNPNCVNMVRAMQLPASCYEILLVGNEPNAVKPYGLPINPTDAVSLIMAISSTCPNTKLIVGNVSADDWSNYGGWGSGENWLRQFLRDYRSLTGRKYNGGLGIHCYVSENADYCLTRLRQMRNVYSGEMWLTEMGVQNGDLRQFQRIYRYASIAFERVAVYTNRQPHLGEKWELVSGVEMVNADNSLTPIGLWYSQR